MQAHGLADFFLAVKKAFGEVEEPVIKRRLRDWKPQKNNNKGAAKVVCGDCINFTRNKLNPEGGMGRCDANSPSAKRFPAFPSALRLCVFHGRKN
jgi:hypothetical protein